MTQKEGDIDLQYFLPSGKSFNQHDRDKFVAGFCHMKTVKIRSK